MATLEEERNLEETSTWAVAVVCFVLVVISIVIEHVIHAIAKWLKRLHKPALVEALEKIKAELMLLGFISLLLTVLQGQITGICVSKSLAATWQPCSPERQAEAADSDKNYRRKLLASLGSEASTRRSLAAPYDKCGEQGKVAFVTAYGIHELHIFIFVLAVVHVLYCIITYILGRTKMRKWRAWEDETKTIEYQYHNDPARFRFARETSFGRRHLKLWSKPPIFLWIVCFFRQFFGSVTRIDYLTLRHGFIMAHLAPGSETRFDFQQYISRSLEEDFKTVVGISPVMWFIAVLSLLTNTYGWYAYLWLPFIPLIIILLVGTKLQVIITQMGLRIQDRGDVVKGTPVVKPGDELFWFGRPGLMLFLIHLVLFQNAFQLAFFVWSVYKFSINSCFHEQTANIVIRITMGVIIQVLCSYVTLPLYALVAQMGSSMRPTIFNERVATALKQWHHTAKKHVHGKHSVSHTPLSSRPATPTYGMSPVHLLHNHRSSTNPPDSFPNSPLHNYDNDHWDPEALTSVHDREIFDEPQQNSSPDVREQDRPIQDPESMQLPAAPATIHAQHEINIGSTEFTFRRDD